MSKSSRSGVLLLCLLYAEGVARSTLRGKSLLLDPSRAETEALLKMLHEQKAKGSALEGPHNEVARSVINADSVPQASSKLEGSAHTDYNAASPAHRQEHMEPHAPQQRFTESSELASDAARESNQGGSQALAASNSGAQTLPKWLEKPPYWLPTPPEWGPPPAHIFSSWYSPRTIPQVGDFPAACAYRGV
jgi:hypothetical protein